MPNYNLYSLSELETAYNGTSDENELTVIQEHITYRGALSAYGQDLVDRAAAGIGSNPPTNPPPPPGT